MASLVKSLLVKGFGIVNDHTDTYLILNVQSCGLQLEPCLDHVWSMSILFLFSTMLPVCVSRVLKSSICFKYPSQASTGKLHVCLCCVTVVSLSSYAFETEFRTWNSATASCGSLGMFVPVVCCPHEIACILVSKVMKQKLCHNFCLLKC